MQSSLRDSTLNLTYTQDFILGYSQPSLRDWVPSLPQPAAAMSHPVSLIRLFTLQQLVKAFRLFG
jgi:hypothetical protein